MRCEELERVVYAGGEITQEMTEHAKTCEACRALLENADVLRGCAQMDEGVEVPLSFTRGWRAAVRSAAEKSPRKVGAWARLQAWMQGSRMPARALAYGLCAVVLIGAGARMGGVDAAMQANSAGGARTMKSAAYDAAAPMLARSMPTGEAAEAESFDGGAAQERKIVRTAQLDLEIADMDEALAQVDQRTAELGGEVTYCEVSGRAGEGRFAHVQLSVPEAALEGFLSEAGLLGDVTREMTTQDDMSASYYDNASRLESAKAQKQRLDELYQQAQDMSDVVAITDALFEVQQEIDSLTGANAWIDERADNARVTLYLTEPEAGAGDGFLARMQRSLADGAASIGAFFSGVVLFAAWALPWAALLGAIGGAAYVVGRRMKK